MGWEHGLTCAIMMYDVLFRLTMTGPTIPIAMHNELHENHVLTVQLASCESLHVG